MNRIMASLSFFSASGKMGYIQTFLPTPHYFTMQPTNGRRITEREANRPPRLGVGTTSTSLLLRLKHDDAEAWERFDSFYLPLVRRWCQRLQPADREEIAQQTAERVRGTIGRFDRRQSGSFRAWLRGIVENLLKDFYRSAKNVEPTLVDEMLDNITQPTETDLSEGKRLLYERVVGIMRRDFCEKWVRCFEGIVIVNLSARELAEKLGMKIDAVRPAKYKILKRLRDEFGDLLD